MAVGLGQRRMRSPRAGLGAAIVAGRGGVSQSGASAQGGAAPGTGGGRGGYRPMKVLKGLQTGKLLTPQQLAQAARALSVLETRPQIRGYSLLAKQLHNERETEAQGLGRLGSSLQSGVSDVYHNIAQSEAQSLATQQALASQLNTSTANIAHEGEQNLAAMQNTQTGGVESALAARGAPGGGTAQQELAAAVASQKAAQSANSQASQQFAAQQGTGTAQLAAQLAGATQQQGAAAVGGIGGAVINRIAKSGKEYGQSIQEARSKLAEAKANRGASYVKNLLGLRGEEQKFKLGEQAVTSEKEKLAASKAEAAKERALKREENATAQSQWAREFGLKRWEAQHPNASSNKVAEKKQEIHQDVNEVKSLIATLVGAQGRAPKNGQELNGLIAAINSKASANPTLVRKVTQRWWQRHQRASTQGNRGKKGATTVPHAP